jgi:hypothetical protein
MSQPEMTLPDLPPRRALPPGVRERLRRRVRGGGAGRAPLAAAAAVAVLAAGGAIVAQSTQGDLSAVTPPSTATSSSSPDDSPVTGRSPGATGADAARCGFGSADVRFTLALAGRRLLVAGDDRFCELTHTTVSVAEPDVGPVPFADGAATVLWQSGSGVLIVRAPAGTSRVRLTSGERTGRASMPVSLVDDLVVTPFTDEGMSVEFTTPSGPVTAVLPVEELPGPRWAASREELPPGDPDVARCLDEIMQRGESWVGDPLRWRPGAFSGTAVHALLAIHDQAGTAVYCELVRGRPLNTYREQASPQRGTSFEVHYVTGSRAEPAGAHVLLAGKVDARRVGAVEVTDPQGRTVPAAVRDGTFAVRLDDQPPLRSDPLDEGFRVSVFDHESRLIEAVTLD